MASLITSVISGDMELKQNKSLPAEKQIVTANPDIRSVSKQWLMIPFESVEQWKLLEEDFLQYIYVYS